MVKEHWCGLNWADRSHAVCVVDETGGIRARFEVDNAAKSFSGLVRRLVKLQVAGVAIERPDGPMVEALMEAGLTVYVVAPAMLKAVRSRYGASGAKSDRGDAFCLGDFLRTATTPSPHRLGVLLPSGARRPCGGLYQRVCPAGRAGSAGPADQSFRLEQE